MKERRLTDCQRRLLNYLVASGGKIVASVGHKQMDLFCQTKDTKEPAAKLSVLHIGPLKAKGFIRTEPREGKPGLWVGTFVFITDAGRKALEPKSAL